MQNELFDIYNNDGIFIQTIWLNQIIHTDESNMLTLCAYNVYGRQINVGYIPINWAIIKKETEE